MGQHRWEGDDVGTRPQTAQPAAARWAGVCLQWSHSQVRSAPSRHHFPTVSTQGKGLKSGSLSRNVFLSNDVGISLRKADPQTHDCVLCLTKFCFHITYEHQDMGVQCDIPHSLNKTFKNMNTFLVNYAI